MSHVQGLTWSRGTQLFVMGEIAVELFQETPTSFLMVRRRVATHASAIADGAFTVLVPPPRDYRFDP